MATKRPDNNRRRPGEVRDAIVGVMTDHADAMKVDAICDAVAERLGIDISRSSVRSYLNLNEGPGKRFKRVGHGIYKLR